MMQGLVSKLREAYLEALRHTGDRPEPHWIEWEQWDRRWLTAHGVLSGTSRIVPPAGDGPFAIIGFDPIGGVVIAVRGPARAFREAVMLIEEDSAAAAQRGGLRLSEYSPLSVGQVGGGHGGGGTGPAGDPGSPSLRQLGHAARVLFETAVALDARLP
jgi:hypothetical protein